MVPRARRCAGCGGPLPETAAGVSSITCPFCGIVNDLPDQAASGPAPVVVHLNVGDAVARIGRTAKLVIGVGIGIAVLVMAFAVLRVARPITDALEDVRQQAEKMEERSRAIAPAELATVREGGWRELKVEPPPAGWSRFEPVAGLGWAGTIARAWTADAMLTRIDVGRAARDGVVDLSGDVENRVGYRFVSPARVAEWTRIADREVNAQVPYELMVQIVQGKVTALVVRGRPPSRARPSAAPDSLPLPEVLARARASGRFADYPFYQGYLVALEREGWVWYLQSLSRRESMPRVRARDGAVYPFRRP